MTTNRKCRGKNGPEFCSDPNCPEKRFSPQVTIPQSFQVQSNRVKPVPPTGAWTDEDTVLFRTQTGSKLYGLAHSGSDDDYYVITPSKYVAKGFRRYSARQSFAGNEDTVYVDFKSFVAFCEKGSPQNLEVMFSRASVSDYFEDYRTHYFCSSPQVVHTYMKTIKSFSLNNTDKKFKTQRHALRLAYNLEEILYTGRFNPTLPPHIAAKITSLAQKPPAQYYKELKAMSVIEVDWDEEFSATFGL